MNKTKSPHKLYVKEFKDKMRGFCITPPTNFTADGRLYKFQATPDLSGSEDWWYILSTDKPAVGFFGDLNGVQRHRWAVKRNKDRDERVYENKVEAMKRVIKDTLSSTQTSNLKIVLDIMNQVEAWGVNKIADSNDEKVVARLSLLSAFEYDRARAEEANKLNIRVSTLDEYVLKIRKIFTIRILGPKLLSDMHAIVVDMDVEKIRTEDLIVALCSDKDKIWATFNKGQQITSKQLATIMGQYMVSSQDKRLNESGVFKVYLKKSILDAYSHYHDPSGADIT